MSEAGFVDVDRLRREHERTTGAKGNGMDQSEATSEWPPPLDLRALARYPRLLPGGGQEVDDAAALLLGIGHLPRASLAQRAATVARLALSDAETVAAMAGATTLAAAAAALFVHRNTLVQRVARIRERTGLDPRVPTELAALRLGLLAREALGD